MGADPAAITFYPKINYSNDKAEKQKLLIPVVLH